MTQLWKGENLRQCTS